MPAADQPKKVALLCPETWKPCPTHALCTTTCHKRMSAALPQRTDKEDADLLRAELRALRYTVVATIGGTVEGHPTAEHNYLQRLRQLVRQESALAALVQSCRPQAGHFIQVKAPTVKALKAAVDALRAEVTALKKARRTARPRWTVEPPDRGSI